METGRSCDEADIRGIMRRYFPHRSGKVYLLSITRDADGREGARAYVGGVTAHRSHERPGAAFAYSIQSTSLSPLERLDVPVFYYNISMSRRSCPSDER